MGACSSRIKFEPDIPSFQKIQEQFLLQTGLRLQLIANLNLLTLNSSRTEIVQALHRDAVQAEAVRKSSVDFSDSKKWDLWWGALNRYNYVWSVEFYIEGFYSLNFFVEGNVVELFYGVGESYFPESLIKVFHDLGGQWVHSDNQISAMDERRWKVIHQRWRRLKKWQDYSWYNRPKK